LELSITLGQKKFTLLGSIKASRQGTDSTNEVVRQMYERAGYTLSLMPQEIKSYINQGYIINPHVYTVINKIIRPASEVPHYIYEKIADKKKEFGRYKAAFAANKFEEADFWASKSLKIVDTIPELTKLLETPNEKQSWQEWSEQGMGFHLLTGEEFIYGLSPYGYGGMFTKLFNMPSQLTVLELGDWRNPVKGYYIDYFGFNKTDLIDPKKVCHVKLFNPLHDGQGSELRGMSPMSALCRVVQRSNDSGIAQVRLIQNGHPVGILSNKSERGMTPDQALEAKKKFRETQQGAYNKGDVLITSSNLEWQALGMSSVDMQLLDADKADLESIARVYEVPLPLMLNDASTDNNMKHAQKGCWNDARLPLLSRRRDALNRWLIPPYKEKYSKDLYIDYDIASIPALKQDDRELVDILKTEIESATLTPNEAREIRNRERSTDPNADKLYIGNLKPLEMAMNTNTQNNEKPKN
jgi:HK97 family phage portal protein